jgi:hypothetical protein
MTVIKVAPILLLDSKPVRVVIAWLDRILRYSGNAIVPRSVHLVNAMPNNCISLSVSITVSVWMATYQCMVVSVANWLSTNTSTSSPSAAVIKGPGVRPLMAKTGRPWPSAALHWLVIVKLYLRRPLTRSPSNRRENRQLVIFRRIVDMLLDINRTGFVCNELSRFEVRSKGTIAIYGGAPSIVARSWPGRLS